jgi:hypothetical protein
LFEPRASNIRIGVSPVGMPEAIRSDNGAPFASKSGAQDVVAERGARNVRRRGRDDAPLMI